MKPIKLLLDLSKKYSLPLFWAILAMVGLVGAQLVIPWIIRSLIDSLSQTPLPNDIMEMVTRLSLIALAVFIARGFMQYIRSYQAHVAGWGVVADARKLVYQHLQRLSLRFYEDKQAGRLILRTVNITKLFERTLRMPCGDVQ